MKTIIYSATISHRHGMNLYHALSEYDLKNQVFGYVSDNWVDMGFKTKLPKNQQKAIDKYFEAADTGQGDPEYIEYFGPETLSKANPLYIGAQVYISKKIRNRYQVLAASDGQRWANEYFKTYQQAIEFCIVNEFEIIEHP